MGWESCSQPRGEVPTQVPPAAFTSLLLQPTAGFCWHVLRKVAGLSWRPWPPPLSSLPGSGADGSPSPAWGWGGAEPQLPGLEDAAARAQPWQHPRPPLTCPTAQPEAPGLSLSLLPCSQTLSPPATLGPSPCGPASVMPTSPFPFHPKVPLGEHRRQPGSQGNLPPSSSSSSSWTSLCLPHPLRCPQHPTTSGLGLCLSSASLTPGGDKGARGWLLHRLHVSLPTVPPALCSPRPSSSSGASEPQLTSH